MPSVISAFTIIVYRKTNVVLIFICIFFIWIESLVFLLRLCYHWILLLLLFLPIMILFPLVSCWNMKDRRCILIRTENSCDNQVDNQNETCYCLWVLETFFSEWYQCDNSFWDMLHGLELFGWKWVAHKNKAYEFMQLIHDSSTASTFERKEESQEQV